MQISEQAAKAMIAPLIAKLLQYIPEEQFRYAANMAMTLPHEFQLLRNRMERIEQNQEETLRLLRKLAGEDNAKLDDAREPSRLRA